jgi:hypothetical protein
MSSQLKDDILAVLAQDHNVAQFASFGPGVDPAVRHAMIRGVDERDLLNSSAGVDAAIEALLRVANTVNVRVFGASATKGLPFHYAISRAEEASRIVRKYATEGLYTIVNETIDVNDGGVSGVALGGIVEFAPEGTPRVVEEPGTLRASREFATRMLVTVYGIDPKFPTRNDVRVEFSLHPNRVGYRQGHVVFWERELIEAVELPWHLDWPNRFSRFIGDKAFGLLVAHLLGAPVPTTTVIGRKVRPFTFGSSTGSAEIWLRTCPVEQVPGKYTTLHGWSDPFKLLANEDPTGEEIASVLAQAAVTAEFSGASIPTADGADEIEGVRGRGDDYMLGTRRPEELPKRIISDVRSAIMNLRRSLGPVRVEWAHDGVSAWILQLHVTEQVGSLGILNPGDADSWIQFDPTDGIDALRELAARATEIGAGVEITRPVGTTSHVGDILRKANVPARLRIDPDGMSTL